MTNIQYIDILYLLWTYFPRSFILKDIQYARLMKTELFIVRVCLPFKCMEQSFLNKEGEWYVELYLQVSFKHNITLHSEILIVYSSSASTCLRAELHKHFLAVIRWSFRAKSDVFLPSIELHQILWNYIRFCNKANTLLKCKI